MSTNSLTAEREHLANLLEAVQRCAHFLHASSSKVEWPLDGHRLKQRQKDEALFEALAAFNERFAKLQDTLGAAMRHSALLMSEANAPFLKVLALFEKLGVIESIDSWQMCRTARNLAAHDYETDCALIAEHFNELHTLQPVLAQPKVALISGVTGENTDYVKMHPRTLLTSGVRLAYEQLPYPWVSTYGDHKPISAWAFASRPRPGGTRMALRLTRAVFTWRAID